MVDFDNIKIGDDVYYVRQDIDIYKLKITKVDDNGITWYRYTNPTPFNYTILLFQLVGKVTVKKEGKVVEPSYHEDSWYFSEYGKTDLLEYYSCDQSVFFHTEKDAQNYIDKMQDENNA